MERKIFSEINSLMEINYVALMTLRSEAFLLSPKKKSFLSRARSLGGGKFSRKKKADTIISSENIREMVYEKKKKTTKTGSKKCDLGSCRHRQTDIHKKNAACPFFSRRFLPAVLKLNSALAVINSRRIHGNVFFSSSGGTQKASVPRNSQRI